MARLDDLSLQFGDTGDRGIEVVDFKPQEHAVAIGRVISITDRPVAVFDLKTVQPGGSAHHSRPIAHIPPRRARSDSRGAAVSTAARFDIGHRDERLGTHQNLRTTYRTPLAQLGPGGRHHRDQSGAHFLRRADRLAERQTDGSWPLWGHRRHIEAGLCRRPSCSRR